MQEGRRTGMKISLDLGCPVSHIPSRKKEIREDPANLSFLFPTLGWQKQGKSQ
jgi:hypothetical protein